MLEMLRTFTNWLRYGSHARRPGSQARRPGAGAITGSFPEAIMLRGILIVVVLGAFVAKTFATVPHAGLAGRSAGVLAALVAFVAAVVAVVVLFSASAAQPRAQRPQAWLIGPLVALTAATAALMVLQPNGPWQLGPALIACFAAIGLARAAAIRTVTLAAAVLLVVAAFTGRDGTIVSVLVFTALPWFVVFRLLREIRVQHLELEASQVAEARAAAAAERGRLVREMHDVLAHSLSALALQLESTRLLARDRGVDEQVVRAVDDAHDLATTGLQEARRAIAAERGDEVPGPERLGVLVESFREQSGIEIALELRGERYELAPDARLAVFRAAQEALTNVRRHATAQSVEVTLDYRADSTLLSVEDHAVPGAPPPASRPSAAGGFGLTGMRERAELLGGRLVAGPTTDGFRVELWLPAQARVRAGARA
ncbi:MAG TPA: histidine kinase [Solirubrobacteraceae bacterium]|nr:histidine kinase [Solirubrobacteraceae bacterium]